MKGQSFPPPTCDNIPPPEVIYLHASSWAFANCWKVAEGIGKKLRKDWYVGNRITLKAKIQARPCERTKVTLLPLHKPRTIHMYDDYPW